MGGGKVGGVENNKNVIKNILVKLQYGDSSTLAEI